MIDRATKLIFEQGWIAVNREAWFKNLSPRRAEEHRQCGWRSAEKEAIKMVAAIEARDIAALIRLFKPINRRPIFRKLTGVSLGQGKKRMELVLTRWVGQETVVALEAAKEAEERVERRTIKLAVRDRGRMGPFTTHKQVA